MSNSIDSFLGIIAVLLVATFVGYGFLKSPEKCLCEKCACQCGCECCLKEGCCQKNGSCCELCTCCKSCGKTDCLCK